MTYDYKTIKVRRDMETMATDAYENLGWELVGTSISGGAIFHVNISFKRDRKIANKEVLLKAQEKVDNLLFNIDYLHKKKKVAGFGIGITLGTIGALTFGGGMALCIELGSKSPYLASGIGLGIAGMALCGIAWFVGCLKRQSKISKIDVVLENEYNKLADTLETKQ